MSDQSTTFTRRTALKGVGLAAASAAGLSACAKGGKGFKQVAGKVPDQYKKRQHIVMWAPFLTQVITDALNAQANAFNSSQTDIFLDVQYQGGYSDITQKLTAAIRAKQVPDMIMSASWRSFYLSDSLAPMETYLGDTAMSSYNKAFLADGQYDGHTYWAPLSRSTPIFYYNRNLFQKAGLPDRGPKTWDELREWGKEFMKAGVSTAGKKIPFYGFSSYDGDWQLCGMLWSWGGSEVDGWKPNMSSAESIAMGDYCQQMVKVDKSAYMPAKAATDLQGQLMAASVLSTGALAGLLGASKFDLGADVVPEGPKGRFLQGGGAGTSIVNGIPEERKQGAGTFIAFLSQPKQVAEFSAATGYIIANAKAVDEPAYKAMMAKSPLYGVAAKQLDNLRSAEPGKAWVGEVGGNTFNTFQQMWTKSAVPDTAFPALDKLNQTAIDRFLKQYGKKLGVS